MQNKQNNNNKSQNADALVEQLSEQLASTLSASKVESAAPSGQLYTERPRVLRFVMNANRQSPSAPVAACYMNSLDFPGHAVKFNIWPGKVDAADVRVAIDGGRGAQPVIQLPKFDAQGNGMWNTIDPAAQLFAQRYPTVIKAAYFDYLRTPSVETVVSL